MFDLGPEPEWIACASCGALTNRTPCWDCERKAELDRHEREAFDASFQSIPASHRHCALTAPALADWVKHTAPIPALSERVLGSRRVMFMGPAGSGKTTLAVACLRVRVPHGRYVDARSLGTARIQHRAGDGEAPLVAACSRAPLLLLDDLGQESNTATNAIPDVIFERHARDAATWVTTGLGRNDITSRYGDGIARRLFEGALVVQLGSKP